ncbi:MAG: glycoside hydrolase family 28 protein [Bacteroidia bacterium]|nr:glycoside hydrolase family 28 protein [Bacteroidia bacterium]
MKIKKIGPALILAIIASSCNHTDNVKNSSPVPAQKNEIEMPAISEPQFPDNTVYVTDFGAVGDGQTLNTKAIADAIESVSKKGGGKVIIPSGLWLTGPIILKSNINIHAEQGALVIFSPDKSLYPLIETSFEGLNTVRCTSPIYGHDLENIAFTGKGIFDGTGEVWRPVKKEKLTESQWKQLVQSGGIVSDDGKNWYPSDSYVEGQKMSQMNVPGQLTNIKDYEKIKDFLRPVMVSLVKCKKVLFDGPVFQNSPAWCIHPLMCEDLIVRNITVRNPWFSQNGDGIDIESCRNSMVYNSSFDVGDDAICIKSGKDADGRKRGIPTENLTIKNCIVYHGHGGVTIGSEMSGGVKNVTVSGCTFIGTDVGIRFKSNRGRGGIVEDIYFSDINMIDIPTQAISFNLYYGGMEGGGAEAADEVMPPVTEETPVFRNITIRNVTCKGAFQAVFLQGLPEQNLENITLENINMEADYGMTCIDANGVLIKGMRLVTKNSPVITINNSQRIDIEKMDIPANLKIPVNITGKRSKDITIDMIGRSNKGNVAIDGETDTETIKIL